MSENVLLNDHDYRTLRIESREALHRLGVPSNLGFTNRNIVDGLSSALGLTHNFPEDGEWSEYSGELLRDSIGELLGLELPPSAEDIVAGLRRVTQ
jgi:hypothetical protein